LTAAADQYALGALIYQMIAGRLPYKAENTPSLMYKHFNEMPTPLSTIRANIPENVMVVLNRALAKRAEDRFPTAMAFAHAFEHAIEGSQATQTDFFTFKLRSNLVRIAIATPVASGSQSLTPMYHVWSTTV
jgi:serine/threonine protein kinase